MSAEGKVAGIIGSSLAAPGRAHDALTESRKHRQKSKRTSGQHDADDGEENSGVSADAGMRERLAKSQQEADAIQRRAGEAEGAMGQAAERDREERGRC